MIEAQSKEFGTDPVVATSAIRLRDTTGNSGSGVQGITIDLDDLIFQQGLSGEELQTVWRQIAYLTSIGVLLRPTAIKDHLVAMHDTCNAAFG